jgi:hypothetical protein
MVRDGCRLIAVVDRMGRETRQRFAMIYFVTFNRIMQFCLFAVLTFAAVGTCTQAAESVSGTMIIVVGASGDEKFERQFAQWSTQTKSIAEKQSLKTIVIGQDAKPIKPLNEVQDETQSEAATAPSLSDLQLLQEAILSERAGSGPLWIVMFGHGTFDGKLAKFNLRGPDLEADYLKTWLSDNERPCLIVNCASASAPFLNALSGKDRVVITATKSGYEMNATRFGGFFVEALSDLQADLDKDEQVSLLEAFLFASARVSSWYESEGRLATEHALLDDNADMQGTTADFFRGVRVVKQAKDFKGLPDGPVARQYCLVSSEAERKLPLEFREQRDAIELEIERLRVNKTNMSEEAYFDALEIKLIELARLYQSIQSDASP